MKIGKCYIGVTNQIFNVFSQNIFNRKLTYRHSKTVNSENHSLNQNTTITSKNNINKDNINKNNIKKQRFSWYMYDWANSAYTTSVITVFIGPYLTALANSRADKYGNIDILGFKLFANSLFAYVVSLSVIFQFFLMPLIGAIADKLGNNKLLMGIFAYIGAISTSFFYYSKDGNYEFTSTLLIISNVCFGISIVLYNSYLGYISSEKERDSTSSIGWAIGYLGGAILLGINLLLVSKAEDFGLTTGDAVRYSLLSAGVWWGLFTIIPMIGLNSLRNETQFKIDHITSSFKEIKNTLLEITKDKILFKFLLAFLLYNDGVQAVIALAATFGSIELNLSNDVLIKAILLVQVVAFIGSLLFNLLAKFTTSKTSLIISIIIWIFAITYAFKFLYNENDFYILSVIIGLVLGGTQALSRSIYSQLIPNGKEAEYFSFYELSDKGTSWLGTLIFALSLQYTHSYRIAILSLILFFVIGLILLFSIKLENKNQ